MPSSTGYQRAQGDMEDKDLAPLSRRFSIVGEMSVPGSLRRFLARDHAAEAGRVVELSVLPAQAVDEPSAQLAFLLEAHAAAKLSHKNIATSALPERLGDTSFFVSEHPKDAQTLRQRLDRGGWFDIAKAVEIASQVAEALEQAHRAEVLHLKLEPEQVWVGENGTVTLTGFGVPRLPERDWAHQRRSRDCALAYRSPEQLAGGPLDERSDLYMLGVLLYEMLTDMVPFYAPDADRLLHKIALQKPPAVDLIRPDIPQTLSAIVARLLAKNPADRFASAAEVGAALRQSFDSLDASLDTSLDASPDVLAGFADLSALADFDMEEAESVAPAKALAAETLIAGSGEDEARQQDDEPLSYLLDDCYPAVTPDDKQQAAENESPSADNAPRLAGVVSAPPTVEMSCGSEYPVAPQTVASPLAVSHSVEPVAVVAPPAATANRRKLWHYVLLTFAIGYVAGLAVFAYSGRLPSLLKPAAVAEQESFSAPSSDTPANGAGTTNESGDEAQNPGSGQSAAPGAKGLGSSSQEQGDEPNLRLTHSSPAAASAARANAPVTSNAAPDVSKLRQQLRRQNQAKVTAPKTSKQSVKRKPARSKPRSRYLRWRFW